MVFNVKLTSPPGGDDETRKAGLDPPYSAAKLVGKNSKAGPAWLHNAQFRRAAGRED